jgi:cytochrome oxidase assembly protein ShyY1
MTRAQRFWVVLLATLVTMAVTASLGLWQLDRASPRSRLFAQIEASRLDTPLDATMTFRRERHPI